jgi:predicted hydrocarbon binding protein
VSAQASAGLPASFLGIFLQTLRAELGEETLLGVFEKANLPADLLDPQAAARANSQSAAEAYARIQHAMRVYYGRGARGSLVRIGRLLWSRLLETASLSDKARAQWVRALPLSLRHKAVLELVASLLRASPAGVTVHTLDLDLLLVDHAAAATLGQSEPGPICSVTLGLLHEALFWATGREQDVEEIACHAAGGAACEFKVKLEGK